ncbi:MAG: alpha/beta fold hydrolase [Candidatus Sericytochromatia bacterium]
MSNLRTITLHGDRVAYRDEGAGEVLLLIHGVGGSSQNWRELAPILSTKYRVIAPDLLGHGESDKPRGDYSLGAFAVWLRDFLDALGISKVTVVGHSFGGGVALQFAHQHKEYVRRLVLVSSGGLGGDLGNLLRMLSLPGAELALRLIASRPAIKAAGMFRARKSSPDSVTRYSETFRAHAALSNRDNRQAFLRTLRSVVDHRGQAVCALNRLHVDLPTMIIFGDQDRCIPVAHAYAAHSAMPGSRLHVLPGVLHHPHVERPETVMTLIDDFMATTGDSTSQAPPAPCFQPQHDVVSVSEMRSRRMRQSHKRFLRAG